MATKTLEEWINIIKEHFIKSNVDCDFRDELCFNCDMYSKLHRDNFVLESIDHHINADSSFVIRLSDEETSETVYIKFIGEYDSWADAYYWRGVYFVEPKEKTVIIYEKVEEIK